ncbi:MAG: hypothetical protein J6T16_00425 [Opitutales bacterium]|nr:hypothetical protein [Opitutales bacterium]
METIKINKNNDNFNALYAAADFINTKSVYAFAQCVFSNGERATVCDGARLIDFPAKIPAGAYNYAKRTKSEILLASTDTTKPNIESVLKKWVDAADAIDTPNRDFNAFCNAILKEVEGKFNIDFLRNAFNALGKTEKPKSWQRSKHEPLQIWDNEIKILLMPLRD